MRRTIAIFSLCWGAALFLCPRPGAAQAIPAALARDLDQWYGHATQAAPGQWGVAIANAAGEVLWSANPDEPLLPASTAKIFTTGFARSIVGPDATLPTRVVGLGHVDSAGTWQGAWTLELNGDPTFERTLRSGRMLRQLTAQLHALGVRTLIGALTTTSANGRTATVIPAAWDGRYPGELYAPPIGAVTLHENTVSITARPGRKLGDPPEVVFTIPAGLESMVRVEASTAAGSARHLHMAATGDGGWTITGSIGLSARPQGFSAVAEDPEQVLECAWGAALERAGIAWDRGRVTPRTSPDDAPAVLAEVSSPPFDSIASEVNRRSLNVGAELLLRWAAGAGHGPERLTRHVRQVVGPAAVVELHDGSGLSPDDRVAARTEALYLAQLPRRPGAEEFPLLLPANGMGTLRRLGRGVLAPGVVRAKTGTLDSVSALAGYLGRRDGVLVISALYNGARARTAKRAQWALFRLLGAGGVDLATAGSETQLGGDEAGSP
ncbi:MAG TPA: D-alanyl-D-alanine carboxypeptidase/D-alanyl-D-alanine-endopeptidase [Gemmatimonadales bacterium]|nr:D-alanyl-D-alanine carboxypeptidase/D-alanyl-D-alanine-endopeptidase [Gemmatimonadales bacterium]